MVTRYLAGVLLLISSAAPSWAAMMPPADTTTDLGVFTGMTGSDSAMLGRTVPPGMFTDTYTFSTVSRDSISASITNSYTTDAQDISPFTLTFYSGIPGSSTEITSVAATSPYYGFESGGFAPYIEKSGSFFLVVSGTSGDTPTYGGSLSLSVSQVPLPSSAPMFGAALIALGAAGYGLKRKSKAASAV